MKIAKINKTTGLIENTELHKEIPLETDTHTFAKLSVALGDGRAFKPRPVDAEDAKAAQLATLREPVVVEGVTFPVLRADMGFYGATHAARNNPNMAYPLPLLGDDGVIVALDADDVDRVYNAILTAIATRASAQA